MLHREISSAFFAGLLVLVALFVGVPASARADDDLSPRIGRVAEIGGELFLAPQDAPDQWIAIGLNYPVATGDNLWAGNEGRAEIDFGGGQFRMAGDTSLHLSRLDEGTFALFIAQGRVIVRIRALDPGESARIDTPNSQVAFTRPGLYRIEVSEDRLHTMVAVREGEAIIDTGNVVQQVLPGQSASLDGTTPQYAQLRNGLVTDGFDTWSANRDRHYERNRANSPVSRQMVGYADLDEYGAWETAPEYGAVWYPANVSGDWAPYRNGYWTDVGVWGPTWVDAAPWGYAPFHYGRWAHINGRWGWCPGGYVARPVWAPALVGWVGGPGWRFSTSYGAPVYGWVPLGWGEAYHPNWKGCSDGCWARYNKPYAVNIAVRPNAPLQHFVNSTAPGAVTAVPGSVFTARKPVQSNLVALSGTALSSAPVLAAPTIRPESRQASGIRPGNGMPPPASTYYAATPRPPRALAPVGPIPNQGGVAVAVPAMVAVPPVPRAPSSVSVQSVPLPVAKPQPTAAIPQANTYSQPIPRPPASTISAPAGNPTVNPISPPATATGPSVAAVPPRPASTLQREPRGLPMPSGMIAPAPAALAGPPAVHQVPVAPTAHVSPGTPLAVTPTGQPHENPKVEKPAVPVVRAPGDVPAK